MSGYIEKFMRVIEISDKIIAASLTLRDDHKQAMHNFNKQISGLIAHNPNFNAYQRKTLENEFFTSWNESVSLDTEEFWQEVKNNKLDFERKEPLRFVLKKNRFRNVHEAMEARVHWQELKQMQTIKERYAVTEMEPIGKVIQEDQDRRLVVLKKCLRKKQIPQSQYLKFGECMAYFYNTSLMDNFFQKEEVEELYTIWGNFRSK
jgi:hypothetical protein